MNKLYQLGSRPWFKHYHKSMINDEKFHLHSICTLIQWVRHNWAYVAGSPTRTGYYHGGTGTRCFWNSLQRRDEGATWKYDVLETQGFAWGTYCRYKSSTRCVNSEYGKKICGSHTLNRFELFNPIGSKYYIVENSISIPQSVTGWCTAGIHFRSFVFSYVCYWPPFFFLSLERLNRILFKPHHIICMMYIIMSETFI